MAMPDPWRERAREYEARVREDEQNTSSRLQLDQDYSHSRAQEEWMRRNPFSHHVVPHSFVPPQSRTMMAIDSIEFQRLKDMIQWTSDRLGKVEVQLAQYELINKELSDLVIKLTGTVFQPHEGAPL
jgi:hypothetical protein